ncbi:MAG TPA: aminotransferase class I/II-fold pyridoxal phosphate-dependent enzyme [Terriglobales bacterium]|nr:aminotransferase class I/II-fold pyridoxal phosphate-dependent enzyme [Terriglobales bacterium]
MLKPRDPVAALEAYRSPLATRAGLNLDLNENTGGCSDRVLARLRSLTARDVSMYPDREAGERLLAEFLGVPAGKILLTNGIDDGLLLLTAAYLGEGDEMLLADPTFVMYPIYGNATGAQVVRVPSGSNLEFPTVDVLACISSRTRLIAIANPNNPTGGIASRQELLGILDAVPDAAVLIDEAYFEFGGETLLPELPNYPNLFIARTFSKAYGLAGLRLGVLIAAPDQMGYLRRFCSPFNVNAVALACLPDALADREFVRHCVAQVQEGRVRLTSLCDELDLRAWPSYTNFVLVRIGARHRPFVDGMSQRGISVRDVSGNPGCAGCVRITIGTGPQMDEVLAAIRSTIREIRR